LTFVDKYQEGELADEELKKMIISTVENLSTNIEDRVDNFTKKYYDEE